MHAGPTVGVRSELTDETRAAIDACVVCLGSPDFLIAAHRQWLAAERHHFRRLPTSATDA